MAESKWAKPPFLKYFSFDMNKKILYLLLPVLAVSIGLFINGPIKNASLNKTVFNKGEAVTLKYSVVYVNIMPVLWSRSSEYWFSITFANGTPAYVGPIGWVMPTLHWYLNAEGTVSWNQKCNYDYLHPNIEVDAPAGNYIFRSYFGDFEFTIL